MANIATLLEFIRENGLKTKLCADQISNSEWNEWLTMPIEGYLDYGTEPLPITEVKSIEILCFITTKAGRHMPVVKNDKTQVILDFLNKSNIKHTSNKEDETIKINLDQFH